MKTGILGAGGRMGLMLIREVLDTRHSTQDHTTTLAAACDRAGSPLLGQDAGTLAGLESCGVLLSGDTQAAFDACDALIDFTTPAATLEHAALAALTGKPLVIGTTGLQAEHEAAILAASKKAPVLYAQNMSLGVNLLAALVTQAAARLDLEYDIEIYDAHHRHKTDAPSGTALMLGHAAAQGRGVKLQDAMVPARFGDIGPRPAGAIGIQVFRGGDVVGDHTVTFAGMGERIELTHKASNRAIFAQGAVKAALWLQNRPAGLYGMADVLDLAPQAAR